MSENLKVSDLIELKELRPVIQLGNQEDEHEALQSFVWTENLKDTLEDFSKRCQSGKGGGIFLKGHYGTGKSHLLSYLSQTASRGLNREEHQIRYKATAISLIRHSSSESLESITLSKLSIKRFENEDRDTYFKRYLSSLTDHAFKGFMVLYDELSEFLKSKPTPAALAEDIRFLQFIAEFCNHHQSWIIGAIQEDIEGIGHASRETSLKLKDRFTLRWTLSTLHVEDLLSERLLQKRAGASEHLEDLYRQFNHLWPESFHKIESFKKIYPLHPGALDFLMGLGTLFSEHRGVLRFVLEILKGLSPHQKATQIDAPANHLICADQIFDYFSERFQENLELKEYYHKVWVHLESRSKSLIEACDHELALQCLKIIILANLDPRREGIDLEELTSLCMFELGGEPSMAHEYLRDSILGKLLGRVNYLILEDQRYKIKLQHLEFELLNKLVEQRVGELDIKQLKVWEVLIPLMDRPPMDFSTFWEDSNNLSSITWLNSQRRLKLEWSHEASDADIRIALPEQNTELSPKSQLTLIPRPLSQKETKTLLSAATLLILQKQNSPTQVELQAKTEAEKRIKHESHEWRGLLEVIYREGTWYLGDKKIQLATMWDHSGGFEANLEYPVYDLLSERHPHFRNISPKIEYYNERSLNDLIEGFVKAQKVSEAALKQAKLYELVIGIARPLGLAVKEKSNYRFEFEPNHHPFLLEFYQQLKLQNGQLLNTRENLAQGPYGLPAKIFDFMIWALVESGLYEAFRDQELVPAPKLSFYNIRTITHINPVATLPRESIDQLLRLNFFIDTDQSLSAHGLQHHLWGYFVEQTTSLFQAVEQIQSLLESDYWSFCFEKFKQSHKALHELQRIATDHPRDPLLGLQSLLDTTDHLELIHQNKTWIKDLYQFYKQNHQDLPNLINYLEDDFHEQWSRLPTWAELANDRQSLLQEQQRWSDAQDPWNQIKLWIEHVKQWQKHYIDLYQSSHQRDCQPRLNEDQLQLLQKLSKLGMPNSMPEQTICTRDQKVELQHKPFCRCGYVPQNHETKDLDEDLVLSFIQQLNLPEQATSQITESINSGDYNTPQQLLDRHLTKDTPKIQTISIRAFKSRLKGKVFNRETLKQEFESWLNDISADQFKIDDH